MWLSIVPMWNLQFDAYVIIVIYIPSLNRTYVELRLCSVDCIGVYSVTLNRTYVELRHFIHGFNSCIIRALNRTYVELRPMHVVVCMPFRCLSIVPMWTYNLTVKTPICISFPLSIVPMWN